MKNLIAIMFGSFLLISSCTCNDNEGLDDTAKTENEEMMGSDEGQATAQDNMKSGGAAANDAMTDEEFAREFNITLYTPEEVREYRRMHDEMDWGTVPGYYPEGSTRPLNDMDTKYLTEWGHMVMLNEIYARHGMRFNNVDLKEHFNSKGWYNAQYDDVQNQLTDLEKENIAFLKNHKPS